MVELTRDVIERKLEKIPELVNLGLLQKGKTIKEINSNYIDKGDPSQELFANLPVWHTKKEMDTFVQEKLKLTDLQFNEIKWDNGKKKIPDLIAKRISALRDPPNGLIVDWKKIDDVHSGDWRTGIWRGTNSAICIDNSESKSNVILKEKINYYVVSNPWTIWEDCIREDVFEVDLGYSITDVDSAGPGDLIFFYQTIDSSMYFKKRGIFGMGKLIDKQITDSKCILKIKKIKIAKTDDEVIWLTGIPWTLPLNHLDDPNLIKLLSQTIQKTWDIALGASSVPATIPDDIILQAKNPEAILPMLTLDDIDEGYDLISEELLIPKEKIIEIITALLSGRHVLLAGPIGTGKTKLASLIPEIFWKRWGGYASEDHTATSEWSTLDVIGGILPKIENNQPTYDIQNGCVVETVIKNSQIRTDHSRYSPDIPYCGTWLVIDEFNRAEIDKAFGQLFTALRTQELKIPTNKAGKSYEDLKILDDYRIIGTLNSTDTHFLFGLSDALKSRFAYIEVGIPKSKQFETEIYYAVNNALIKLKKHSSFDKIKFDHQEKKILKIGSDEKLYKRIMQAYYTLDAIRVFKKLGTAVLQLIYQNMIVGDLISVNRATSLDNALISTLIPQIDHESSVNLNVIQALFTNNLGDFFKKQYSGINRDTYLESFKIILDYLEISNKQNLLNLYEKGKIGRDDTVWKTIQEGCRIKTNNLELNLPNWTKELDELKKSQVI